VSSKLSCCHAVWTLRRGKSDEEAAAIRLEAFTLANQTVKGLQMLGYECDSEDFMDFARSGEDLFLTPDQDVIEAAAALSARFRRPSSRAGHNYPNHITNYPNHPSNHPNNHP
jgi:hypothetical protein